MSTPGWFEIVVGSSHFAFDPRIGGQFFDQ
jgi:hypothetical protein